MSDRVQPHQLIAQLESGRLSRAALGVAAALGVGVLGRHAKALDDAYAKDPCLFVFTACYTFDAHQPPGQQILPFPDRLPLRAVLEAIHESPKAICMKSRQLLFSWLMSAYALWTALYGGDAAWVLIQSRKEEDAAELVCMRVWSLWSNLPEPIRALHPLMPGGRFPRKKPPEIHWAPREGGPGARITGVPQGAAQWRSRTVTLGISDEAAFQEQFSSCWTAADACVQGGGKHVSVTTPNGQNFAWRIYTDHQDLLPKGFEGEEPVESTPCKGLRIRLNRNGVTAIRAHRHMFEERDETRTPEGEAWFAAHRPGKLAHQWEQEQEINPFVFAGQPVLYDFREEYHTRQRFEFSKGTVFVGVDYGYRRPYACLAQRSTNGRVNLIWELMGDNVTVDVFADALLWACGLPLSMVLREAPPDFTLNKEHVLSARADAMAKQSRRLANLRSACDSGKFEHISSFDAFPRFELSHHKFLCYDDPAGEQVNDKSEYTSRQILGSRGFYCQSGETSLNNRTRLAQSLFVAPMEGDEPLVVISRSGCPILYEGAQGGWRFPEDVDDKARKSLPDKAADDYYQHAWDGATYMLSRMRGIETEETEPKRPPVGSPAWKLAQAKKRRDREGKRW